MAEKGLTQDQVWDDSELLDSWNEALAEYTKYHSLAAKGEMIDVKDVQPDEQLPKENTLAGKQSKDVEMPASTIQPVTKDQRPSQTNSNGPSSSVTAAHAALTNVQDEDLRNLMMSWYYAGYYTGLCEGKQQGYAAATQNAAE